MQEIISSHSRETSTSTTRLRASAARIRKVAPSVSQGGVAVVSALLLILSFPDFNLWPLAWIALVPLLLVVARNPQPGCAFFLGWLFGTLYFYGSCYWLTYSMIHFGGISPPLAYLLLLPGAAVLGIFPAVVTTILARAVIKGGLIALFMTPPLWAAFEWVRLETTGQLWNAVGYSQAFHPLLIQTAGWGGVYAVSLLVVMVNAAIAYAVLKRDLKALSITGIAILLAAVVMLIANKDWDSRQSGADEDSSTVVIAVQPNVPMDLVKSNEDLRNLTLRHFEMSEAALRELPRDNKPRLVIWPESPMNFAYGGDTQLRGLLADFAAANGTSILLNSQEVAPNGGLFNSAVLINQQGSLVAQYDKIQLLPFGEYVPLPGWIPGAGLIRGIVGDFTPGTTYKLMSVGDVRAGVFICIEAAYPSIARRFTIDGADVLINISNDGYLGPTAVMRQHLANTVFRAVENGRPLLRVTNTGISAFITPGGEVTDATLGFLPEVRTWRISRAKYAPSFYASHGDLFAWGCAVLSVLVFVFSFKKMKQRS